MTTFAWDWATGVPELLSDGDKRYLVGHDTLSWEGAGGWTYSLPDALGSVRQAVDGAGGLLESREWSPYGEEVGDAQAGLGYTGEWWDAAVGLEYLRARWYDVRTGAFLTRDAVEENHPYQYANGNPIRFTDPTGLFPDLDDIEGGAAEFSCNCGWIDWNHVRKSNERAFTLIDDLRFASVNNLSDPALLPNWYVHFGIPLGLPVIGDVFDLFHDIATIPQKELRGHAAVNRLALSIFMDANEGFEEMQGAGLPIPVPVVTPRLTASYYSEEDLPSDIMGFYIALQRHMIGASTEELEAQVRRQCHVVGSDVSKRIFKDVYHDGDLAQQGWRNWFPRFLPLTEGCNKGVCVKARSWPSAFSVLTAQRVIPRVGERWWWLSDDLSITYRHYPVFTDRSNVFRLTVDDEAY